MNALPLFLKLISQLSSVFTMQQRPFKALSDLHQNASYWIPLHTRVWHRLH